MTTAKPLKVLDLTDDLALNAARLLVGTGADVIRLQSSDSAQASPAEALHWHAGKRVVRVPSDQVETVVRRLLPGADVVLESGPRAQLCTLSMRQTDPVAWTHIAHVVVTPFGLTGPRCDWRADDTVASAAGGMAWLGGDASGPPVPTPRQQSTHLAGSHAAIAAVLALLARRRTGRGQLAEVSVQEAVAATLETGAISWIHAGSVPGRTSGVYAHVAHRVFPTADGFVAGGYSGPNRMWDDLLSWMAETDEAQDLTDAVWRDPVHRWRQRDHVDAVVTAFTRRRTTAAIATEGRVRALPWAAVATPQDLLENPQLAHRKFFLEIDEPGGSVRDAGFPYESPGLPRPVRLRPPTYVGPDLSWKASVTTPIIEGLPPSRGALTGLRVLDLTWVLAGPYVTKTLAEHGADIVKVESRHRQDPTRFAPSMRLRPGAGPDESGYFLNFNRNKRSLALNLRTEGGVQLLQRLARQSDVIVENFSPGTLDKWGLGWPQLRELNPRAILVSMAGVGADGPWRSAVTFADTLAAMSGLTHETGTRGRPPQGLTFGLGDMVAANAATLATLERLLRGEGGHVDLSQLEAMTAHLGTAVLDHALDASMPEPPLIVRTVGEDRWLAVGGVPDDELGRVVTQLVGENPGDPRAGLAALAADCEADELATRLQAHGIPAYPVRDGRDLVTQDEQLAARGFYRVLDHSLVGKVPVDGLVEHLADTPGDVHTAAPLLGAHTTELLEEILGLSRDEITALRDQGVLE